MTWQMQQDDLLNSMVSKRELAMLYFPEAKPRSAESHLMKWVNRCPQLKEALSRTGYTPRARLFTPRQLRIILHYLGDPQREHIADSNLRHSGTKC